MQKTAALRADVFPPFLKKSVCVAKKHPPPTRANIKEWEVLLQSKGREKNRTEEEQFKETLCDLFDMAHADAMTLMTISHDREFLEAQRRGIMQGVE